MTVEEKVAIDRLDVRADLQPRESLDEAIVAEYAAAMEAGDEFPPIRVVVSEDGDGYMWMWDGFHRVAAAKRAGKKRIHARIETGTLRDAILRSVQANATHGLRRSNADKRKAVQTLLQDPEWSQWSNREIARRTKTSHPFVAQIRETLDTGNVSSARKYRDGSGEVRTMETGPIAEANEARAVDGEGVDDHILAYLVRTSVEYATNFIKDTNLATAKAALKYEQQNRNRSSLIDLLERRIRYLEQDAGKDGASQDEVLDAVEAYLADSYAEEDFEGRLHALRAICQLNDYDVIRARLGRKPAAKNGVVHAVDEMVRRVSEQRNEQAKAAKATMEQLRAGVWAYLDDDYETYDLDGRIQALSHILKRGNYVDVLAYVPENREHGSLELAVRQALWALTDHNEEKRRLEREAEQAEEPEYAPIWKIEKQVRRYLNVRWGIRGERDISEDNLRRRMDTLLEDDIYEKLAHFFGSGRFDRVGQYRKNDLIQAVNNVAAQIREQVQTMQKPDPTVRYESVDVPETVEAVAVVEPDEAREAAVRVTYLPQTESDAVPSPRPEEDAGPATIDLSLTLFPEDGKFHLELSERDVPSGPYRGRLQNLHRVLDVAITRVWPEAKALLTGEDPEQRELDPEDDAPHEETQNGRPRVGDYVRWGSGPGTHGKLVNTSGNGNVGYVRDPADVIRKFPMHMLTVVQQAAVS